MRKPSSSGFFSSSAAWSRAQAQLLGVAMSVASSQDQVLLPRASVDAILGSLTAASSLLTERGATVNNILAKISAVNSLLAEGVPVVPSGRQRKSTDESVGALEYLESQAEAEHQELHKDKHGGRDSRKGRSKGRPRDIASRSRSGDRRGHRQDGPSGSRSCLSRKGKDKGRGKGKDAPPSGTPCYYKSAYEDQGCMGWASFRVRMKGRSATPKVRAVCRTCGDWLFEPSDGAASLADYDGAV